MSARSWPVSCSVGAVTFDAPPDSVDVIVAAADRLMYRVKESGKSAVRVEPFSVEQGPGAVAARMALRSAPGRT